MHVVVWPANITVVIYIIVRFVQLAYVGYKTCHCGC